MCPRENNLKSQMLIKEKRFLIAISLFSSSQKRLSFECECLCKYFEQQIAFFLELFCSRELQL